MEAGPRGAVLKELRARTYFLLKQTLPLVTHGNQLCLAPQASVFGLPRLLPPTQTIGFKIFIQ